MPVWTIVMIIILVVLIGATIALYFLGKKAEAKQAEQDELMQKNAQPVTMLIIDKKKLPLKDSGLPESVISQAPWYSKRTKLPLVKAKVGPKVMTLIADSNVYEQIPLKKEVKAMVSGLYITSVKGLHGRIETPTEKPKGLRAWAERKRKEMSASN